MQLSPEVQAMQLSPEVRVRRFARGYKIHASRDRACFE
jgi:hypothetical protein